jgi:hypothetical protein
MVPLKTGDDLITVPVAEFNQDMGFVLQVSLNESAISEGSPLIMSLRFMCSAVMLTLSSLAPFL